MASSVLLFLDLLSGGLVTLVAMRFIRIWRLSSDDLHLLIGGGFLLLAIGMSVASQSSAFDLHRQTERFDGISLIASTASSLVLLAAYLSARWHGAPRPSFVVGSAIATLATGLVMLFVVIPPPFEIPNVAKASLYAHIVQMCAFMGCVIVSGTAFFRAPSLERAFVPAAFMAYVLGEYTWVLYDVVDAAALIPVIYAWRFVSIGFLVAAVLWRPRPAPAFDPSMSPQ